MALLRREQILAAGRPAGYRDLADFLVDVREGRIPRTGAIERIAQAFECVLVGKVPASDLDVALALRAKRGRREATAADLIDTSRGRVCRFIETAIASDPKRRGARSRALAAAAEKFRLDLRTVERTWKRTGGARELDALWRRLVEASAEGADLIRRHVTAEEMQGEIGRRSWSSVVALARARAEGTARK